MTLSRDQGQVGKGQRPRAGEHGMGVGWAWDERGVGPRFISRCSGCSRHSSLCFANTSFGPQHSREANLIIPFSP